MIHHMLTQKDGHYHLMGALTHAHLTKVWEPLLQQFFEPAKQKIMLDVGSVEQVDSSFLAFLLALLRMVRKKNVLLEIEHLPENIKALMQVQGIWPLFEELIR